MTSKVFHHTCLIILVMMLLSLVVACGRTRKLFNITAKE